MASFKNGSRFLFGRTSRFRGRPVILPPFIDYSQIRAVGSFTIDVRSEYRIDLISFRVYGQTNLGWYIMAFNGFDSVSQLRTGVTLRIPPIDIVT